MSELISNLNTIESVKLDIKSAIKDKGVDMTGLSFQDYPTAIGSIQTGGTFVTETLRVSVNNTYYPGYGVDGFSMVVVDVPQSVTGYTEKDVTEGRIDIVNLNNSASYVASNAFMGNNGLLTVNLPNCSTVNDSAFNSCTHLSELNLPVCKVIKVSGFTSTNITSLYLPSCSVLGSYAFQFCKSLISVDIPEVETLSNQVFQNCSSLQTVTAPKLKNIALNVFNNCSKLQSVDFPECSYVGNQAFASCPFLSIVNLSNCLSIAGSVFASCTSLNTVNLNACSLIGNQCFTGCTELTNISAPNLIGMGGVEFERCSNVSEFIFPNCISVSGALFNNCLNGNINVISFPVLMTIGKWYNNPMLLSTSTSDLYLGTEVYGVLDYTSVISSANTTITGSIYVNGYDYNTYITANGWSSISDKLVPVGDTTTPLITFNDGVISGNTGVIGPQQTWVNYLHTTTLSVTRLSLPECRVIFYSAFSGCRNITSINLPKCTTICNGGFESCYGLSQVSLPKCEFLYDRALKECSGITEIDLPNCRFIGSSVFYGVHIASIKLGYSSVCYLSNSNAFQYYPTSIYVPASLVDAYKSDKVWSYFKNYIVSIPE